MLEDVEPASNKKIIKFKEVLKDKTGKRAALFTHACPDPDAIGSMLGISWLLKKCYDIDADLFYSGHISHPQNIAICNLLDVNLIDISLFNKDEYDLCIVLDTIPVNTSISPDKFDICIDHHKEIPNGGFNGLFINLKAGSCCATIYNLIREHNVNFEDDNESDSRVATAILVGIITDTNYMMSDDTTEYEFEAYSNLFAFRNSNALKDIVNFKRPKFWIETKAQASADAFVGDDSIGVVGLGILPGKDRDLIADMADEMLTWANVETAVVFAVIDGDKVEGSVRSNNPSVSVPALCSNLVSGKQGSGGGKLGKGAYRYNLVGLFEGDEDEETKKQIWNLINQKEQRRIFKMFKK